MIRLYDYALSGNCFKVRLLLGWLGLEHECSPVDFYPGFEHRGDAFLDVNPLGQLPVIEEDGQFLRDAQAILVHLATKFGRETSWYPSGRVGEIQQWLAFADSITCTISAARLHDAMFFDLDATKARSGGKRLLRVLDDHLWFAEQNGQDWIVAGVAPTIADIACFPYVALAEEGGIDTAPYGATHRWMERFMRLDGFKPMAGMLPLPMPKPKAKDRA